MSFDCPTAVEKAGMGLEWLLSGPLLAPYVRSLNLRGEERLLEVGCAGGAVTRQLLRVLPRGRVIAVDPSAYWVNVARRRFDGIDRVAFHVGDVHLAGLRPSSFDAVLIHFVLHEIPAPQRASTLARIADLLKPGGRLLVREPTRPSHGIPPHSLRNMVEAAGFCEVEVAESRRFLMGPCVDARYVVPRG